MLTFCYVFLLKKAAQCFFFHVSHMSARLLRAWNYIMQVSRTDVQFDAAWKHEQHALHQHYGIWSLWLTSNYTSASITCLSRTTYDFINSYHIRNIMLLMKAVWILKKEKSNSLIKYWIDFIKEMNPSAASKIEKKNSPFLVIISLKQIWSLQ